MNARCYMAIDEQALYLKQEVGSARIPLLCDHGDLGGDHEESVCSPRPKRLHTIFERHFGVFCAQYDEKYAATYGRYRPEGIQ